MNNDNNQDGQEVQDVTVKPQENASEIATDTQASAPGIAKNINITDGNDETNNDTSDNSGASSEANPQDKEAAQEVATEPVSSEVNQSEEQSQTEHENTDVVEKQEEETSSQSPETESQNQQQEPAKGGTNKELFASDKAGQDEQSNNPLAINPTQKKKSNAPKAAIIVAVVIGLALVAVSVYAYIKMNDDKDTTTEQSSTQPIESKPTVSGSDVDSAVQDVEAEIDKTNDATEIPSEESVSDSSLGL